MTEKHQFNKNMTKIQITFEQETSVSFYCETRTLTAMTPQTLEQVCKTKQYKTLWQYNTDMYTKIQYACQYDMGAFIEKYVTSPLQLNHALQCACEHGRVSLVKWILSRGIKDLNICDAIDVACSKKHLKVLSLLIQYSGLNIRDQYPYAHVQINAMLGDISVLKNDCLNNNRDCHRFMLIACEQGYADIVSLLTDKLEPKDYYFSSACLHGHEHIVKLLLEHDNYKKYCREGFLHACHNGHLNIVKCLLGEKMDTHVWGLVLAYVNKKNHVVSHLQSQVFNNHNIQEIIIAEYWRSEDTLKKLLSNLSIMNVPYQVIFKFISDNSDHLWSIEPKKLLQALQLGIVDVIKCALDTKICHDAWFTLLTKICQERFSEYIELILDHIIEQCNAQDCRSFLLLYVEHVIDNWNERIVQKLKKRLVWDDGLVHDCFDVACAFGNIDMVKYMLLNNKIPSLPIGYGFHAACNAGNPDIVMLLYPLLTVGDVKHWVDVVVHDMELSREICNSIAEFIVKKHPEHLPLLLARSENNLLLHAYLSSVQIARNQ
jgi:hypothetical protein